MQRAETTKRVDVGGNLRCTDSTTKTTISGKNPIEDAVYLGLGALAAAVDLEALG